jgi:hypothetical protein
MYDTNQELPKKILQLHQFRTVVAVKSKQPFTIATLDITNNDITNNDITNNDITNNDITNNDITIDSKAPPHSFDRVFNGVYTIRDIHELLAIWPATRYCANP